jgi:hypothetical protein
MRRATTFLTLLAATAACQSYVAVPVSPVTLVSVAQRNTVRVATMADVLLVVDDSASMSGKQDRLAAALAGFTVALDSLQPPVDYQVAVTTTTISERLGACGPVGDSNAADACDSNWQADGFACDTGFACFRAFPEAGLFHQGPQAPAEVLARVNYTAAQFSQYLSSSVQVGTDGSRQPQGMESMRKTLGNPGFLRDGAKLVVAFFTDAEDCSDPSHRLSMLVKDPATGNIVDECALQAGPTYTGVRSLEPVATYANYLRSLTNKDGSSKEVEIGSIISLTNGTGDPGMCSNPACDAQCDSANEQSACNARCAGSPTQPICVSDCIAQCHTFCGGQVPGRRYQELAYAFNGIAGNVCSDDASPALSQLSQVIGIPKQITLRAPPDPGKLLVVRVERGSQDILCQPGQDYQLVTTQQGVAVAFMGACVLQPNDTWDIRYLTAR